MINFIPKAFDHEEDSGCPICPARKKLEALLDDESARLTGCYQKLSAIGVTQEASVALSKLPALFAALLADYRVAYGLNLAIWFAAEQHGRAKRVPELLLAYEEYRTEAKASFVSFDAAVRDFLTAARKSGTDTANGAEVSPAAKELDELERIHREVMLAEKAFWVEVDKWTDGRRDEAAKIV